MTETTEKQFLRLFQASNRAHHLAHNSITIRIFKHQIRHFSTTNTLRRCGILERTSSESCVSSSRHQIRMLWSRTRDGQLSWANSKDNRTSLPESRSHFASEPRKSQAVLRKRTFSTITIVCVNCAIYHTYQIYSNSSWATFLGKKFDSQQRDNKNSKQSEVSSKFFLSEEERSNIERKDQLQTTNR